MSTGTQDHNVHFENSIFTNLDSVFEHDTNELNAKKLTNTLDFSK